MTTRTDAVSGEVSRHESWAIEIGFDEPLRLTDCDHAVAVLGDLFEPWDIRSVSAPLQSRGGPCSVTLGDDGTLDAREIGEPLDGRTIKVYRVTHPGPDQVVEDIWQGVIDEVSTVDRASMTITGAVWGLLHAGPSAPLITDRCVHAADFKGPGCGYPGSETWCNGTHSRCMALGNSARYVSGLWAPKPGDSVMIGEKRITVPIGGSSASGTPSHWSDFYTQGGGGPTVSNDILTDPSNSGS